MFRLICTLLNSISIIYLLWKDSAGLKQSEYIKRIVKKESQNSYKGEEYLPRVCIDAKRLITGHSFVSMRVKMNDNSWNKFMVELSELIKKYNEQEEI